MQSTSTVLRVLRAAKRSVMITLAALVLTSAVLPTSASSAGSAPVHATRPSDGYGDNPTMP